MTKRANPHSSRHSRATSLANHLTEAQMKEYFGWVQGSDMAATYVHLSGRDVDRALLRLHNVQVPDNGDSKESFSPKHCGKCGLSNPPSNRFCSRCGMVLDEASARQVLQQHMEHKEALGFMDQLLQDPVFRRFLDEKLKELVTKGG